MAYVVTEACVKCKFTDCVSACPVDCFYEGENMLVIHPDECIDCGACVSECPVEAIYAEADVPPDQFEFIALNRDYATQWLGIKAQKSPMDTAEEYRNVKGKLKLFSPKPGP